MVKVYIIFFKKLITKLDNRGNKLIDTLTKSHKSNYNDDYERRNFGEHKDSLKLGGYFDTITIEPGQKHDEYSSH